MSAIRTCTVEDIPAVARMFQNAFRDPSRIAPRSLENYLRELFLEHPWRDPETESRVFIGADGHVHGFIGVLPVRMSFHGQRLRAALASSLVVDNPAENPMAGARLLRSYLTGPQDLCISETSNPIALGMWERVGGQPIAGYSMEWLRPLKPASLGVALIADRLKIARILHPLASLADSMVARFIPGFAWPAPSASNYFCSAEADDESLLEHVPNFAARYALRPDWDRASLGWFLRHAARKDRHGQLFRRMVYNRKNEAVGCYLYYGRPRGIAWVLQILAAPEALDAVIADLLNHASQQGCFAVRGRTQPHLLDPLLRHRSIFFQRSSTTVHTGSDDLLATIRSGDAFIIGLAGEGWTRLIGDNFA